MRIINFWIHLLQLFSFLIVGIQAGYAQKTKTTKFDFNKVGEQLLRLSNTDELFSKIDSINIQDDTVKFFQKLKSETNGYISLGYSYGLNTVYRDSSKIIGSIFSTQGALNTQIMKLPVKVSYNYTTLRVPLGTNNYFRISYDKEKFERNNAQLWEEQKKKLAEIDQLLNKNLGEISELQSYIEVYLNSYKEKYLNELKAEKVAIVNRQREKLDSIKNNKLDSLNNLLDSAQLKADVNYPSSPKLDRAKADYEKIQRVYEKIMALKENYTKVRAAYDKANDLFSRAKGYNIKDPDLLKSQGNKISFLKAIKKVDLGLTYPASTGLSTQTTAVKGIGTEFQFNNFYVAASSGVTLNNVMVSTNDFNNELVYNQNVFNQFDFQHVVENGILSIVKGGYGTPQGTHAFVGINHLTNTKLLNSYNGVINPAMGMELDLKYNPKFIKGASFDFVYAKTSINRNIDSSNITMLNSLFSDYKSNSYLFRYAQDVRKLRSNFSFSFRHLDIGVNTMLYGQLQPGNRRILFESKHKINAFIRIGTHYKYEEGLNPNYIIRLNTVGSSINGAYGNNFTYYVNLNYVNSLTGTLAAKSRQDNYLFGIALQTYSNWNKSRGSISFTYNDMLIPDTASLNRFSQIGIALNYEKPKFLSTFGYDYFYQSNEVLTEGTNIIYGKIKYRLPKSLIDGGLKYAFGKSQNSLGWHIQYTWEILSFFEMNVSAEKFVRGNLYRNYYQSYFDRFPYLFRVGVKFKI